MDFLISVFPLLLVAGAFLLMMVKVLREYERAVVFRLGRLIGARGPGLILLVPLIDRMVKVDLRTVTMEVHPQEVITRDNIPVRVDAVVYFRVVDAARAIVEVENYHYATSQIARTTLRSVVGQVELDELLAHREQINQRLQRIVDEATGPWGVKVSAVEIKDVELPEGMKRAMARQAEAERERRAKVIHAEGEFQASEKLQEAAAIVGRHPVAVQLRYLQTLTEIAAERNSTIIFPVPVDLLQGLLGRTGGGPAAGAGGNAAGGAGAGPVGPAPER